MHFVAVVGVSRRRVTHWVRRYALAQHPSVRTPSWNPIILHLRGYGPRPLNSKEAF